MLIAAALIDGQESHHRATSAHHRKLGEYAATLDDPRARTATASDSIHVIVAKAPRSMAALGGNASISSGNGALMSVPEPSGSAKYIRMLLGLLFG